MHHHPGSTGDDSFAPGERLKLEAEPDNPHDPLAIGVWNADETLKIGHVPAVIVANLAPNDRTALVLSEQSEASGRTALRILISREAASLRVVPSSDERDEWARVTVARMKKQASKAIPRQPIPVGDPMEQMARMLEDLGGKAEGPRV